MSTACSDPEIDEIQRRMSAIRRDMHLNVKTAVESAERLFDWKQYITRYPWLALSLAAAAGFIVAPARRSSAEGPPPPTPALPPATAGRAATVAAVMKPATPSQASSRGEWVGLAIGVLAPVAVRVAQNYTISAVERWIEAQLDASWGLNPRRTRENIHDEPRSGMAGRTRGPRPL